MIDIIATIICGLTVYFTAEYLLKHFMFFKDRKILAWILGFYPMQMLRYLGAKYFNINQVIFGHISANEIIKHRYILLSVISFFCIFFVVYYQIKIAINSRKKK